jgi:hypothetical protein
LKISCCLSNYSPIKNSDRQMANINKMFSQGTLLGIRS